MRIDAIATEVAQWSGELVPQPGYWFPDERRWGSDAANPEEGRAAVKSYLVRCQDVSVASIYMDGDGNVTGLSFGARPANLAAALKETRDRIVEDATRG